MSGTWETRKKKKRKVQIHVLVELLKSPILAYAVSLTLTLSVFHKAANYPAYHTDVLFWLTNF